MWILVSPPASCDVRQVPKGCRVISTEGHGVSFWANTGRIDVELADGIPQSFFIKVLSLELGKNMVHGEFESMKAIYSLARLGTETHRVGNIPGHTRHALLLMRISRYDR